MICRYLSTGNGDYLFEEFIEQNKEELLTGETILCFYDYQLKVFQELYGDDLVCEYSKDNNWWECRLKNPFKYIKKKEIQRPDRYKDVPVASILELKNKGYTIKQIAEKYSVSYSTIRRRLGKENSYEC